VRKSWRECDTNREIRGERERLGERERERERERVKEINQYTKWEGVDENVIQIERYERRERDQETERMWFKEITMNHYTNKVKPQRSLLLGKDTLWPKFGQTRPRLDRPSTFWQQNKLQIWFWFPHRIVPTTFGRLGAFVGKDMMGIKAIGQSLSHYVYLFISLTLSLSLSLSSYLSICITFS